MYSASQTKYYPLTCWQLTPTVCFGAYMLLCGAKHHMPCYPTVTCRTYPNSPPTYDTYVSNFLEIVEPYATCGLLLHDSITEAGHTDCSCHNSSCAERSQSASHMIQALQLRI